MERVEEVWYDGHGDPSRGEWSSLPGVAQVADDGAALVVYGEKAGVMGDSRE